MRKQFLFTLASLIICFSLSSQTWYQIDSPTDKELKTIQFISNEIGFIGGDSVLLKTVDGGVTWNEIVSDFDDKGWPQSLDVYDLHFFDENHGYLMTGLYGAMLETFDGGLTWVNVGVTSGFCQQASLYFENENYGFAGGAGCFEGHIIAKYEDGIWTQAEDPDDWSGTNYVTTINFKDATLGFAGTIAGTLLRTIDGGDVWDTIPNLASGFPITDIDFDQDLIRVTHHNVGEFGSMISADDGLNWEYDAELASFYYPELNALHTTQGGTAYAAGTFDGSDFGDGIIFEKQEIFWSSALLTFSVNDIGSHSDSSVFAVGEYGAIYTNQADIANSIIEIGKKAPIVYPNPITSGGFLTIEMPKPSSYSLRLEDISGACIIEKSNDANSTASGIQLEGIGSGVYILHLISVDLRMKSKSVKIIVE